MVAVRLHQQPLPRTGRRQPVQVGEQLGDGADGAGHRGGPRVVGEELDQVRAQRRGAAGLQAHHGAPGAHVRLEDGEGPAHPRPGGGQLPGGDQRQPAARARSTDDDVAARRLQHAHGVVGDGRLEGVGEGVHPQQHRRAGAGRGAVRAGGAGPPEGPQRQRGQRPARVGAHRPQRGPAERADPGGQPGRERERRGQPQPLRQPAEGVVRARADPAGVRAVQHLGLVGGHVGAGRAVAGARLAAQAEVQRPVHLGCGPAAVDPAGEHLLQRAGPAAGGVLLLPGGQVGGAHEPALAAQVGAAGADAGAAVQRGGDVAAVGGEGEPVGGHHGQGARAAQVGVQRGGPDDDAGVHPVVRVQQALEPGHRRQRAGRVHGVQQLRAGPAVAVLAGQRPAVAGGQLRRPLQEPPHRGAAVCAAGSRSARARSRRRSGRRPAR